MKQLPIYILIIVLIALLVFRCGGNDKLLNNITETHEVIHKYHDTIIRVDTFNHYSLKVDTIVKTEFDTLINDVNYNLNEYHYNINDSLLSGTIIAKAPFKPDVDFKYKLKSFNIKDSIVVKENNYRGFLYGGDIVVEPLLTQMSLGVAYQFKKGDIIDVSVGRDFNNNHNIIRLGYKKRF